MSNESCTYTLLKEQEIKGAGIIVPKEHRETVFDLTQESRLSYRKMFFQ
ncbi:hypothetical protein PAECIP111891_02135 [Paenibacillus allorhizoplanae]|uniref:Uncharacterized protein n=1 Tax=Paenibacillus allorhizoplanae TaxID=2905648 RepID=A0ABN8GC76_9BACL|nr:hypothetical protein PAECIP111891_02135 [Paenibacillus allorhizoplanae]